MLRPIGLRLLGVVFLGIIAFLVTSGLLYAWQKEQVTKRVSEAEAKQRAAAAAQKDAAAKDTAAKPSPAPLPAIELPTGRVIFPQSDVEARIREVLDQPAEFQYLDTKLKDVAHDLGLRFKIPILLDVPALTADGKGGDTELTLSVKDGSFRASLRQMLDAEGLTFAVRNDALLITTKTAAETITPTRIYQVHDLVVMPNDPTASKPDFDGLLEIITSTIQPETWREAGGTQGEFKEFRGPGTLVLVITQTEAVHEQIEALLNMLREARDPNVLELQKRAKPVAEEADKKAKGGMGGGGFF